MRICTLNQIRVKDYKNLILLTNNDLCKFEIGAYKIGIKYLLNHNLINNYNYYFFTQDTFVIKNKYDVNNLLINNITASSIVCSKNNDFNYNMFERNTSQYILNLLNLKNDINAYGLCWCCSFVLHKSKINNFLDITDNIIITSRLQSSESERYLSSILYYLNNFKMTSLDGELTDVINFYDCWTVDIFNNTSSTFFIKRVQQKTENTIDL